MAVEVTTGAHFQAGVPKRLFETGLVNPLVQFGVGANPELPDVPSAVERAGNAEQRQVLRLLVAGQFIGRPLFSTPEIPADRR